MSLSPYVSPETIWFYVFYIIFDKFIFFFFVILRNFFFIVTFKEELLTTNNLFVDYFNAFLSNPELGGEILRFNFVTGDLELIQPACNETIQAPRINESRDSFRALGRSETDQTMFISTAEGIKLRLESQIKAIIKSTSRLDCAGCSSNSSKTTAFGLAQKSVEGGGPQEHPNANFKNELLFEKIKK